MATTKSTNSRSAAQRGATAARKAKLDEATANLQNPDAPSDTTTTPEPKAAPDAKTEKGEIPAAAAAEDLFAQLADAAQAFASEQVAAAAGKASGWLKRRFAKVITKAREIKDRLVAFLTKRRKAVVGVAVGVAVVGACVALAYWLAPIFTAVMGGLLLASLVMQFLRPALQSSSASV